MVSWALHILPTPDLRRAEQSSKVGDLRNTLIRRCFSSLGDTITLQTGSPALRSVLKSGNRLASAKLTNDKFQFSVFRFPTIPVIRTFCSRSRWSPWRYLQRKTSKRTILQVAVYSSGSQLQWREIETGQLPEPNDSMRATLLNDIIYISGGHGFPSKSYILSWDPSTETWKDKGDLTVPRKAHAAVGVPSSIINCPN